MSGDASPPDVSGAWFAAMRRGDWEAAWRATDRIEVPRRARQREPGFERRPEELRWDGTPAAGRTVLVRCEHGLGDTLQFMRFVPQLQAAHVHFMVQPHLLALLRGAPGLGEVRNYWTDDPLPPHEVDLEVMELPYALRMTLPRLAPPYPHLPAQLRGQPPFVLPDDGRLRPVAGVRPGPQQRAASTWSGSWASSTTCATRCWRWTSWRSARVAAAWKWDTQLQSVVGTQAPAVAQGDAPTPALSRREREEAT